MDQLHLGCSCVVAASEDSVIVAFPGHSPEKIRYDEARATQFLKHVPRDIEKRLLVHKT